MTYISENFHRNEGGSRSFFSQKLCDLCLQETDFKLLWTEVYFLYPLSCYATSSNQWLVVKTTFSPFCFLFPYLFCFPNTFIVLYLFLDSDTRYQCVTLGGSKVIAWYLFIQTPPHISSSLHKQHWHSGTTLWHQAYFCNLGGFSTYTIHYCAIAVWGYITS